MKKDSTQKFLKIGKVFFFENTKNLFRAGFFGNNIRNFFQKNF